MWNMRKWIIALSLLLILALPAYAGQTLNTVIEETTLTKATSAQSVTLKTRGLTNLTVFIEYADTTDSEPLVFTLDASYDGTNFTDVNFYDYASSAAVPTLQIEESITADGWYYLYWVNDFRVPYIRISMVGTTWLDTSSATVTVYTVQER